MEFETAKRIAEESGSNFLSSFSFLPKEKAQALNVIYAYCRLTDDIVDQNHSRPVQEVQQKLEEWRKETRKALRAQSENPLLKELALVTEKYVVPEEFFLELIDGVEMDCTKTSYKTFEELYPYCYKVASVVGLICLKIFGAHSAPSKDYAVHLGVAFQLTNILRDIATDAQRNRIYIPEEDLAKFSLTRENFLSTARSPLPSGERIKVRELILYECQRAEHFYKKAKEYLALSERPNLVAAEVMCSVYYAILQKIKKNPLSVFHSKVQLHQWELILRSSAAWLRNRLKI